MPLQSQVISVDLTGGLQQHADAKHLPVGALTRLENGRAAKLAAIEKRPGNVNIGNVPGVQRLLSHGEELLAIDGQFLWSYSPTESAWIKKDKVSEATATTGSFPAGTNGCIASDIAISGSVAVVVWRQSLAEFGSIFVSAIDLASGTQLVSNQLISTDIGFSPNVAVVGSTFYIVYGDSSTGNVLCRTYAAGGSVSNPSSLKSDLATSDNTPIAMCALSDGIVICYKNTTPKATLAKFNTSLSNTATVNPTGITVYDFSALTGTTGEKVWLGLSIFGALSTSQAKIAAYDPSTLTETLTPTNVGTAVDFADRLSLVRVSSTSVGMAINTHSASTIDRQLWCPVVDTSGAAVGHSTVALRTSHHAGIVSRPFLYNGKYYGWLNTGTNAGIQFSYTLCDLGFDDSTTNDLVLPRPVAKGPRRTAVSPGRIVGDGNPGSVQFGSKWITPGIVYRSAGENGVNNRTSLASLTADFADVSRWTPVEMGKTLYLSGGVPSTYDGSRVSEIGFEYAPAIVSESHSGTGGTILAGTYNYVAVTGWIDETGDVHRSIPSVPFFVTTTGTTSSVTLNVTSQCITTRQDVDNGFVPQMFIEVYRTAVNSAGPYYSILPDDSAVRNLVGSATNAVLDVNGDAFITSNRQLYTGLNGTSTAVIDNVDPPSSGGLVKGSGVLWSIGDDGTIWYTKARVEGEAMSFADEFNLQWDDAVPPTALATIDQSVIVFSESKPYVISGQTPNDSDVGGSLQGPTPISSDYGCTDSRCFVTLPDGLVFLSAGGIAQLDRGFNVNPRFGWAIQDTLDANPTITSAILHPTGQYLMMGATAGSTTGARFYYDYTSTQWGVDLMRGTSTANAAVVSMCTVGGKVYWADADGNIYREDPTTYLDAGNWVTLLVETPEIVLSGLHGFQRAWQVGVLGTRFTSHDITIKLFTDYESTPSQTQTFLSATTDAWPIEEFQVHVARQLCKSVRVQVSDATPTGGTVGTGRGTSVEGVALELGTMGGVNRLPAVQRG